MAHDIPRGRVVDPFDLPEWLGSEAATWVAGSSVREVHLVEGALHGSGDQTLPCDLLAVDRAYPVPVLDADGRHDAHQAWTHGQVLILEYAGRTTLAVPGTAFTADLVLEALGRLAKAVGVPADRFSATLRL